MEEQLIITERRPSIHERPYEEDGDPPSAAVSPVVILSTCVAVIGSFTVGLAAAYASSAEAGIIEDLGFSIAEYSVFGSIVSIGAMVGAIFSGKVADLIGRRATMWLTDVFYIFGWLSALLAKEAWLLDVGRVSMGIGFGLQYYVGPLYVGEIAPKSIRGACTFANQFMVAFGMSTMYVIGNLISWRILAAIGLIPCLLRVVGLFFIPESPRWLVIVGQENRSETVLQRLWGGKANVYQEATEIRDTMVGSQNSNYKTCFNKKYARTLMIAVGLIVHVQFGGAYAIGCYASSIFEAAGCSSSIGSTALAILQLLGALSGLLLLDKCGRRPLLLCSAGVMFLGNILVGLAFLLQDLHTSKETSAVLALIGILVISSAFSVGISGVQWLIISEILPVDIKSVAGSLIILLNWFLIWVITYTFNFVFEWSSAGTFFIFAGVCGSTFLFVAKLLPETKGRTLEEIQVLLSN